MRNSIILFIFFFLIWSPICVYAGGLCTKGTVIIKPTKNILKQFKREKTTYIIKDEFDLRGGTLIIPSNCCLLFEGGLLKNGTIVFNDTRLIAEVTPIFLNLNEANGQLNNTEIIVEWFNCTINNTEEVNQVALNVLTPLAIRSRSNIYFASKGGSSDK